MDYLLRQVLNGLAAGSIYALVALGYNMVYGILELINFAHGDTYIFGAYLTAALLKAKLPVPIALLLGFIGGGCVSLLVERFAYRPVRGRHRVTPMISAVGAALVLQMTAQLIWGAQPKFFPQILPSRTLHLGALKVGSMPLMILGIGLAIMAAFTLVMQKTKMGTAVRCVAQDIPTSRLMGIEVDRVIQVVYFLGGFLGTIGGTMFATYYGVLTLNMGFAGTIKAWTVTIVGGIGNLYASFLGGLLFGVVEALISGYISSQYRDAIVFALVLTMLVVRPSGLLGRRIAQKA